MSGAVSGLNLPLMTARACCPLYSLYSALCSLQFTSVTVIKDLLPNADNTKFSSVMRLVREAGVAAAVTCQLASREKTAPTLASCLLRSIVLVSAEPDLLLQVVDDIIL